MTCKRLVITLPVGVLQAGDIETVPAFPAWKQQAINSLGMGKVVVVPMLFDGPLWGEGVKGPIVWKTPAGRVDFHAPHTPKEGAAAVVGWISGDAAAGLSALQGEQGMDQVLGWLSAATGVKDLKSRLQWHSYKDWVSDPYTRGSYSFTPPGAQGARSMLARAVDDTIYFAGEATAAAPHYQTVHGAYTSGKRAAREVLDSLGLGEDNAPVLEQLF